MLTVVENQKVDGNDVFEIGKEGFYLKCLNTSERPSATQNAVSELECNRIWNMKSLQEDIAKVIINK